MCYPYLENIIILYNLTFMKYRYLLTLLVGIFLFTPSYAQTTVQAIALFNNKAMLSVDGGKAKIIKKGDSYKGVRLLSSNTDQAVVEINGQKEVLTLNSTVALSEDLDTKIKPKASIQLRADKEGFFRSNGEINGRSLNFLVDTGANLVVLSSDQANRIGLEYRNGTPSYAVTASGTTPMYAIQIPKISFGGLELTNIEAGVIEGSFPVIPLLGMTFLSRLNMTRNGNIMKLTKR